MSDFFFINGRAAVHRRSSGRSVAFPDVCLCPPTPPAGPVPTPLPNTVVAGDLDGGAESVLINGNPAGTKKSSFMKSTGNEVSRPTGGGVMSTAVQGRAKFGFGHSFNVFFEGQPAVRHMDPLTHNHGPGAGNTPPAPWLSTMDPDMPRPRPAKSTKEIGTGDDWIEIQVVDEDDRAVPYAACRIKLPDGKYVRGQTLAAGTLLVRNIPKGKCEVTVGPDASTPPCATQHRVRRGECLVKIAADHSFTDWRPIYAHANNAELRKKRPNPHVLKAGDTVFIPERPSPRPHTCNTGRAHKVTLKLPPSELTLHLSYQGAVLKDERYEIWIDGVRMSGTTDNRGHLRQPVAPSALRAKLYLPRLGRSFHLNMGDLDPLSEVSGLQQRLQNLGFTCDDEDGQIASRPSRPSCGFSCTTD